MRKMKGVEMIKLERTADHIEKTLQEAFKPQELEVSDVSEAHRGTPGFKRAGKVTLKCASLQLISQV